MIDWIKRAGGIAAAAIGLLAVGVLGLGIAANTVTGLVGVAASLPHWAVVAAVALGPALGLVGMWAWRRR